MTADQWGRLISDYGLPVAAFIFFAGGTIAGIAMLKKSWPIIASAVDIVRLLVDLPDRLDRLEADATASIGDRKAIHATLDEIKHEVLPNNGSSLSDSTRRNENSIKALADHMGVIVEAGLHVIPARPAIPVAVTYTGPVALPPIAAPAAPHTVDTRPTAIYSAHG